MKRKIVWRGIVAFCIVAWAAVCLAISAIVSIIAIAGNHS